MQINIKVESLPNSASSSLVKRSGLCVKSPRTLSSGQMVFFFFFSEGKSSASKTVLENLVT